MTLNADPEGFKKKSECLRRKLTVSTVAATHYSLCFSLQIISHLRCSDIVRNIKVFPQMFNSFRGIISSTFELVSSKDAKGHVHIWISAIASR